jgi:acetoin utilization protein AcuB
MRLGEVMKAVVKTVGADEDGEHAWELMRIHGVRHLVVAEGRKVIGVVTDADLGGRNGKQVREGREVGRLMSPKPRVATPGTTVREAANMMKSHSIACLPVVERGRLVGVVTAADLLDLMGHGVETPMPRGKRWVMKSRGENKHHRATSHGGRL